MDNQGISPDSRMIGRGIRTLLITMTPFILILLSVRILLAVSPVFVNWEYRRPSFPEDPYGFDVEDRIYWSRVDIRYLLDSSLDISYFDDFQLENGEPMHNDRELSHMEDVRNLSDGFWTAGKILILLFVLLSAVLWSIENPSAVAVVLKRGASATILFMLTVLLAVGVGFNMFFVAFHRVFFVGDTWLFRYSDTFIRLYPEMFWRDIFILLAGITAALAGIFALAGRTIQSRADDADPLMAEITG